MLREGCLGKACLSSGALKGVPGEGLYMSLCSLSLGTLRGVRGDCPAARPILILYAIISLGVCWGLRLLLLDL